MMIPTKEATRILADEAERLGATPGDENGMVVNLMAPHRLSTLARFCVCCELADREARREGYADALDRVIERFDRRMVQRRLVAVLGTA